MSNHKYRVVGDEGDAESSHSSHESYDDVKIPLKTRLWNLIRRELLTVLAALVFLLFGLVIGYALGKQLHPAQHFKSPEAGDQISTKHLVPSPAYEAISSNILVKNEDDPMDHMHHNPFMGYPTPATDKAWKETMNGYSLRVPAEAMDALNRTSIPLNDGSGDVWAVMSVSHHLHCLDSIRHQIVGLGCKEASPAKKPKNYFPPHIDHCIEMIRQRLMCQPDVGLRSLVWNEDKLWVSASNDVDRECVDWSQLQSWTEKRTFFANDKLITQPAGGIYNGPYTPPPRCEVI